MLGLNKLFNSLTGNTINKKDDDGETKLFRAVRGGNLSAVKKLLKSGADPDVAGPHGITPLHLAAYWGETDIMAQLLKAGANPNADNGHGWTPLHSAALSGGYKSRRREIEQLRRAGAKDDIGDKHGWTAQDYMLLWEENAEAAAKLKSMLSPGGPALPEEAPKPGAPKPPRCGPSAPRH